MEASKMNNIEDLFSNKKVWTRKSLAAALNMSDRQVRRTISDARRRGIPIVALPDGGYKLAETTEEQNILLKMYFSRAINEFETYHLLKKTLQNPMQTEINKD